MGRSSPDVRVGPPSRIHAGVSVVTDIVQQRTSNMNSCTQFFPEVGRGSFPATWIGSPELEEALGLPCPLVGGNQCAGRGPGLSSCSPASSFAREGEQTPGEMKSGTCPGFRYHPGLAGDAPHREHLKDSCGGKRGPKPNAHSHTGLTSFTSRRALGTMPAEAEEMH